MTLRPGDVPTAAGPGACPDCLHPLAATGGCRVCLRCGYSPCG